MGRTTCPSWWTYRQALLLGLLVGGPTKMSLKKANQVLFGTTADQALLSWSADSFPSLEKASADWITRYNRAAQTIPRGSLPRPKGWWSPRCKEALDNLRAARRHLEDHPGDPLAAEIHAATRQASESTIREEKSKAWEGFVSTLDSSTPSSRVWQVARALDGRGHARLPDTPLQAEDKTVYEDKKKADLAMSSYAEVSRIRIRREDSRQAYQAVRSYLRGEDVNGEKNTPFSIQELDRALDRPTGSACSPDGIHPHLLKWLPRRSRLPLLSLLNRSYSEGRVPSGWRRADIIPILKKNKTPTHVKSYRPVSLLSCLSKTLEAMLGTRLEHWVEAINLLPETQAGFRKVRSTLDCLSNICQTAFDSLNKKKMERTLVVAVDFTAAFDRVWRGGLLRQLAEAGIPHLWLRWIRSWLADRKARVRWGQRLGKWRKLHQGVPKGSPLSPLLFIISTAPIPEIIRTASPDCRPDAYADDLTLSTPNHEVKDSATSTQRALDALDGWCARNYFRIAPDKTVAMVISTDPREVNGKARPPLHLGGQQIYSPTVTILGVEVDSQLTFTHHAKTAADKLRRRCNVFRMVAAKSWGANTQTLRHLYTSFVRPAGMYGAGVWLPFTAGATRDKLETVNSGAARTITGVAAGSRTATTLCDEETLPPSGP